MGPCVALAHAVSDWPCDGARVRWKRKQRAERSAASVFGTRCGGPLASDAEAQTTESALTSVSTQTAQAEYFRMSADIERYL